MYNTKLRQELVCDRLTWLRIRRTVTLQLIDGYPTEDIAQELIAIYIGITHPYRYTKTNNV